MAELIVLHLGNASRQWDITQQGREINYGYVEHYGGISKALC